MRNGLTKTLAAIAIACLGYQAYALAPVINQIPSPVVTDDGNPIVTSSNLFIYADFVNLNNYVSDDGALANIIWSYTGSKVGGAFIGDSRYRLNGANPLNLATDLPVAPALAKTIAGPAVTNAVILGRGEYNPDNNPLTPTVRDNDLSPLNGVDVPPVAGFQTFETISMYASDGTTQSLPKPLIIVTEQGSTDHLSYLATPTPFPVTNANFASASNNWYWDTLSVFGSVTQTNGADGLCMAVTALGANVGQWVSPYGAQGIPLVLNSVWRIRATMSTTQTTPGLVPLWDIYLQNYNTDPATGAMLGGDLAYLADWLFLDNTGSADAIKGPAAGLNQFDIWFTPSAVRTAQWNASANSVDRDANNDMRLAFRVLDVAGAGYGGEVDAGTICLANLAIDRFSLSAEYAAAGNPDVYNLNPVINGVNGVTVSNLIADNFGGGPGTGAISDYSVAPLTITPADPSGWLSELTHIAPGDTINPAITAGDYSQAATADNYPIPWTANTLYEMLVDISAPNAVAENNGPDSILLGYRAITNEILGQSFITSGLGRIGMPKQGTPQTYTMLFWGHQPSALAIAGAQSLLWYVDILNVTPGYDRGDPTTGFPPTGPTIARNQGGIRIHSVKVRKVQFTGM